MTTIAEPRCSVFGGAVRGCLRWAFALPVLFHLFVFSSLFAADEKKEAADIAVEAPPAQQQVRLISVPLPITGSVDTNVMQSVDRVLADLKPDGPRPLLVFEFSSNNDQTGEGSQFERAWSLARYITSDKLSRVRTVAYVPKTLKGHAVLVALACEELVIAPDAEFGEAGIGEKFIDAVVQRNYVDIAERRRVIPSAVVLGMLDKKQGVFKVQTGDGVRYALSEELEKLKKETNVVSVDRIIPEGEIGRFSGRDLRLKYGFASHLAADRTELAEALQVSPQALQNDPTFGKGWKGVRIDLHGLVHREAVTWISKALDTQIQNMDVNLIVLQIDSQGGSIDLALLLANKLNEEKFRRVRTVAYISRHALADAAIIALACDQVVMADEATIGGTGDEVLKPDMREAARTSIKELAKLRQVNWSLMVAMIDDSIVINRYTRDGTGAVRYLCEEEWSELKNRDVWKKGAEVSTKNGIKGREAEQLKLARYLANSYEEFLRLYNLDKALEVIQPNWAHLLIEKLASPEVSGVLLFIAWFTLMIEMMTAGFTGAGFVSGVCFLLFFWAKFLNGTAGWLEVLLFIAGAICLFMELFITPGFGILGIGGGVMMVASIILASQTFIIPRNSYQFEQLPTSLFVFIAGGSGAIVSLGLMRRYLPHAPIFKRLMLNAPPPEHRMEISQREELAHYSHLVGQRGLTSTPLVPSGKARFGNDLVNVISQGEAIARGAEVEVIEVVGNRVVVRTMQS